MSKLLQWALNLGYFFAGIIFIPIIIYRIIFQKRYRRGLSDRLGFVSERYGKRPCIWIHAVSVGEVNATRPLIKRIKQQLPFHEIYLSTITDTGYDRAITILDKDHVFFLPIDFSFTIKKAIKRLNPSLIVLIELELWPNLVIEAHNQNIPIIIANGRITEKSVKLYTLLRPLARRLIDKISLILTQDEIYRDRFAQIGAKPEKLHITGSLKWDSAEVIDHIDSEDKLAEAVGIDRNHPLLVAGSTGGDMEEEIIIRAYHQLRSKHPNLQLAIVPRKPERFNRVAQIISSRGFYPIRRSEFPDGSNAPRGQVRGRPIIILGDTMGELRKFYSLATIVIIGRTFLPMGGSDVMEVAALGKPIVLGSHYENFAEPVEKLLEKSAAIVIQEPEKLASTIDNILTDEVKLKMMRENAKKVVIENQGATKKTVEKICEILGFQYDETERGTATPKIKE